MKGTTSKKFELTSETKIVFGKTLHRIKALISFCGIEKDEEGGWVEKEDNLDQSGDAWVSGNAQVYGDAWVSGNARVYGNAQVSGNARVYGNAQVYGNARVSGDARVSGNARVSGDARVYGDAKCTKTPIVITGLIYLVVIDDEMVRAGCKQYTAEQWRKFSTGEIKKMDSDALEFYPTLIGLLDTLNIGIKEKTEEV